MLQPPDLEDYIESRVARANAVLAVGETNMDFKKRYLNGSGDWRVPRLARINANIVCVDIVKENVRLAKAQGYDVRLVDIENRDQMRTTFGKKKFDVILMLDVIEHLSKTVQALENLRDRLTPGGVIIFTTDSPFYFRQFLNRIVRIKTTVLADHTAFIVPENMKQLCARSGLTLEKWDSIHSIASNRFTRAFSRVVKWFHPYFLDHFVYIVRLPRR